MSCGGKGKRSTKLREFVDGRPSLFDIPRCKSLARQLHPTVR